jgi:enamine deaminase RidA (YjgF/YER057c/UK114 family)
VTIRLIRADCLHAGVPYAYAAVTTPGALVFTAGACPLDVDGNIVGADVSGQARLAVENLAVALAAAGCELADVVKTTLFVASSERGDLVRAWEVISAAFGDHDPPSTLLGVAALGYEGQLVEIEAVAVLPGG